jgi:hypothetical protein
VTTEGAGQYWPGRSLPRGRALVDEILREKGVRPIDSPKDPEGAEIFETAEELHEFLEYTYAARRAELA